MACAMNGKNPYQQTRLGNHLLDAHISRQAQQERVKSQIASNESAHLLFIQLRSWPFLKLLLESKYFKGKSLQPFMLLQTIALTRGLANRVNFERLAQLVKVDNILAPELYNNHSSIWRLFQ